MCVLWNQTSNVTYQLHVGDVVLILLIITSWEKINNKEILTTNYTKEREKKNYPKGPKMGEQYSSKEINKK